jgi:hypothetical protein
MIYKIYFQMQDAARSAAAKRYNHLVIYKTYFLYTSWCRDCSCKEVESLEDLLNIFFIQAGARTTAAIGRITR